MLVNSPSFLPEAENDAAKKAAISDAAKKAYAIATKADDTEVPTHLLNQGDLRLPDDILPNASQLKALGFCCAAGCLLDCVDATLALARIILISLRWSLAR